MTIRELLNLTQKTLKTTSSSPSLDAEILLEFVLKKPKEYIYINPDKHLGLNQQRKFLALIKKRCAFWPVAYLTSSKSFMGLNFYITKDVLIPRPVTEELVEMVLEYMKGKDKMSVLDLGTGSGCIIISLAKTTPGRYFASDISQSALKIAKKNARLHKAKMVFKQGNLLKPWKHTHFDIIIANLPYLAKETDISTKHEPKLALIAKKKGLALYEELFKQIPPSSPAIFLEIGDDQGKSITKLATKYLPQYYIEIKKDLTKHTRFAILKTRH